MSRHNRLQFILLALILIFIPGLTRGQGVEYVNSTLWTTVSDIQIVGNYAYCVFRDGLVILDISNPTNPTLLSQFYLQGNGEGIFVQDNFTFLVNGYSGLQIIDISDPEAPELIGTYDTPGFAKDIFVKDNYAYVADQYQGLFIFDISHIRGRSDISINRGWNLISLPFDPLDRVTSSLFPFIVGPAYWYNPDTRIYEMEDTLRPGLGYFILSPIDTTLTITGDSILSFPVNIRQGWNMVGAFSQDVPASLYDSLSMTLPPPYSYNSSTALYEDATRLMPGKGFWLLCTDSLDTVLGLSDTL